MTAIKIKIHKCYFKYKRSLDSSLKNNELIKYQLYIDMKYCRCYMCTKIFSTKGPFF